MVVDPDTGEMPEDSADDVIRSKPASVRSAWYAWCRKTEYQLSEQNEQRKRITVFVVIHSPFTSSF